MPESYRAQVGSCAPVEAMDSIGMKACAIRPLAPSKSDPRKMQNRKSCGNPGKQGESVNTAQWHPQILLKRQIFCFLLLVCPGFADDKSPADVKLIELLKNFDSQAMRDSYVGKRHQAWIDVSARDIRRGSMRVWRS
jgi:hypothetical protein